MKGESIEDRIFLVTQKLRLEEKAEKNVYEGAVKLANKYLEKLSEDEERSPIDVVLSAVYLSCQESGFEISQTQLASSISNGLNRWPGVVEDMKNRL